ncbi:uncharacterized protein LOC115711062 [Cannabis sativa]|uniref:uncharacterized protein LOC115711062 n=1 Tax=Cannabis sativa TaxID=3483 RepID=UPI0029CA1C12|nr:uncharacterized protein LOC115711062 [Cannabis sativa]
MYGEPNRAYKFRTWDLLRTIADESPLPWCVIGDMNNIASHSDKRGDNRYPNGLVEGFQQALSDCNLIDLELIGYHFTWERGRGTGSWVEIRLDRAMATPHWIELFHSAQLVNLEISSSDHCLLLLELVNNVLTAAPRHFKFENAWLREPMCLQVVRDSWETSNGDSITVKIKRCGENNIKRLKRLRDEDSAAELKNAEKSLTEILTQQEVFWKQRSKQLWLREGDSNSKFFHAKATSRKKNNAITRLQNSSGTWVDWSSGLHDVIHMYFSELFTSTNALTDAVVAGITPSISSTHNEDLIRPVHEDEVRRALFQMHPDKAPGPDGMTPGFYQKCWDVVGHDVVTQVRNFFESGVLPDNVNNTNIILIPKKKNVSNMGDLRPISLCNVLYKIISKVLAKRLKIVLPHIISENQSAFIPGRLISDNIMVSYEVMHYFKRKRKGQTGYMALKLDLSKAYDRIEWGFLMAMMSKMGFHNRFIELIFHTISTVEYKIVHGGHEIGPIVPSRGIRQGDSLSPYLFLICAEGFSSLLRRAERSGHIRGCKVANGAPTISHMLFADDSYVYCRATENEADNVLRILDMFEVASGQQVNRAKSSIFFSANTPSDLRDRLCTRLGMVPASNDSFYLGLPCILGRSKKAIQNFLQEKMEKRILSWEGRFLSKAGREILIKTVAQAIPSYAMSVFLLPVETCTLLEKLMSKFWWGNSSQQSRGITWMKWSRLSRHKSIGGLGFRNLRDYNLSLLGKQAWRLLQGADTLVNRVYKARYYPHDSMLNASLGANPSYIWRSIHESQSLILDGAKIRVGVGDIEVLNLPWLGDDINPFVTSSHPALDQSKVRQLMSPNGQCWDVELVSDLFNHRDASVIMNTPINVGRSDNYYWKHEHSGFYTVKSAYKVIQLNKGNWGHEMEDLVWKKLWKIKIPPKVLHFMWKALTQCLPTRMQLQKKHVDVPASCIFCHTSVESISHVLLECQFAQSCWNRAAVSTAATAVGFDFSLWFESLLHRGRAGMIEEGSMVAWSIWKARNELLWKNKSRTAVEVVSHARSVLDQWSYAQSNRFEPLLVPENQHHKEEHWSKPEANKIKVNVDGAIFQSIGSYGVGIVARNSNGHLIEATTTLRLGNVQSTTIEAFGIKEALSWIKDKDWSNVVVETDSLVSVQALSSLVFMPSVFCLLISDCKRLLNCLCDVSVTFVSRSANKTAHCLARGSCYWSDCIFNVINIPSAVHSSIMADLAIIS